MNVLTEYGDNSRRRARTQRGGQDVSGSKGEHNYYVGMSTRFDGMSQNDDLESFRFCHHL
jgi:hypothetical protein